ncbi:hypothetical protein Mpe_B0598 (plasmid) [Methylibium petroleiphilum PM1]|uniref:Uncharacterized protein n=1 Tax=Methylibium petroleiphilum (strain ATCC BAA-1232 / LMG 22953 / PM1) TaxID=420662 RepID=A2SP73_METPP|nr:hypothetical protein Mpe_B0598 [Methylibium petroleiphilum PM1]
MSTQVNNAFNFELRFQSLFNAGRALSFPCTIDGRVDMDRLSRAALSNYLYARALVGREFFIPFVENRSCGCRPGATEHEVLDGSTYLHAGVGASQREGATSRDNTECRRG